MMEAVVKVRGGAGGLKVWRRTGHASQTLVVFHDEGLDELLSLLLD